jgi:hypothetical protein
MAPKSITLACVGPVVLGGDVGALAAGGWLAGGVDVPVDVPLDAPSDVVPPIDPDPDPDPDPVVVALVSPADGAVEV